MPLSIRQFPCLSDNYGFLVRDESTGRVAVIDTPDADAILAELDASGWGRLDFIFNTHWHPDHAGGNERLKAETGCEIVGPEEVRRIAPLDRVIAGGDHLALGDTNFDILDVGGHTLGHVALWSPRDRVAFVGDSLFALGCGRMFEGTPDQMWASLQRLAELPVDTVVYCAHEYTASNARFALSVDPDPAVRIRAEAIFAARGRGEPTVPTTIGQEAATNPFLRAPRLRPELSPVEAFAALRAAKDDFRS
jgi:hydroxyacylglutathione hydrolase